MIVIEHILGNIEKDHKWQTKLKNAALDYIELQQWETQKSRCRKTSKQGLDVGISLERDLILSNGDILLWDEQANTALIVKVQLRDVMVVDLSILKDKTPEEILKISFELGHALGNQHWKAVIKDNLVYAPITVSTKMMDSVMRTHGFEFLKYQFVSGESILPKLTQQETRLLFGGAEDSNTHVHVASPLDINQSFSYIHGAHR